MNYFSGRCMIAGLLFAVLIGILLGVIIGAILLTSVICCHKR